jgi:hypothetical protein
LLAGALPGPSWHAWRVLLIAIAGEPLHASELSVFRELTGGREREPGVMADMFLCVSGRRSGKSRAMGVLCVYLATMCTWDDCLALGERGLALFMAPTEDQADVSFRYACALVEGSTILSALVVKRIDGLLELNNRVDLQIIPASWRRSRGRTAIAICLDECAFLATSDDSLNRDTEIVTALRPSLATTGGPMLLTSSPSTFEGVVARVFKRHHGPAGDARVVVVQSDTAGLNPSLPRAVIDRAYDDDPESAGSEFGGAFRQPISAFLTRALVERAVVPGRIEGIALPGVKYQAHVDVAGGTGQDSFAAAIGHVMRDGGRDIAVLDVVFEARPPFDPDVVVERLAAILRMWGVHAVTADSYASGWPVTSFARVGINYQRAPLTTSEIYLHCVPLFTAGRAQLLDHARLVDQLAGLRRRVGSAGKETVSHMAGAHDDLATAVCGLLWKLTPATRGAVIAAPIIFSANRSIGFDDVMEAGGAWDRLMREEREIEAARERRRANP